MPRPSLGLHPEVLWAPLRDAKTQTTEITTYHDSFTFYSVLLRPYPSILFPFLVVEMFGSCNQMQMEGSLQSLCEFYISLIRRIFTGLDSFGHIGTFCFKQVIGSPQWCWRKESSKQRRCANMESESFRTHCSVLWYLANQLMTDRSDSVKSMDSIRFPIIIPTCFALMNVSKRICKNTCKARKTCLHLLLAVLLDFLEQTRAEGATSEFPLHHLDQVCLH